MASLSEGMSTLSEVARTYSTASSRVRVTPSIAENNLIAQLGAGSVSKNSYIDLAGEITLPRSRKCEQKQ
jgi:hypothetical protein